MSENKTSDIPSSGRVSDALADLKKQRNNSPRNYSASSQPNNKPLPQDRPSNQSQNSNSDNSGCWFFIGVLIVIGLFFLSMM